MFNKKSYNLYLSSGNFHEYAFLTDLKRKKLNYKEVDRPAIFRVSRREDMKSFKKFLRRLGLE